MISIQYGGKKVKLSRAKKTGSARSKGYNLKQNGQVSLTEVTFEPSREGGEVGCATI